MVSRILEMAMNDLVTIKLSVTGACEEVSAFRRHVIKKHSLNSRHRIYQFNEYLSEQDNYLFDFNSIVEMPICLNTFGQPIARFMVKLLLTDKDMPLVDMQDSNWHFSRLITDFQLNCDSTNKITVGQYIKSMYFLKNIDYLTFDSMFGMSLEDGQRLLENFKLHNFCDSNEWCEFHWGSSHNAFGAKFQDSDPIFNQNEHITVEFKTAESFPFAIFEKMAAMFPRLHFEVFYCFGDDSQAGKVVLKDEELEYLCYEPWEEEFQVIISEQFNSK